MDLNRGLGATQVAMSEKADITLEEPMEIPEPQKQGVSDESDPVKAAQEILSALKLQQVLESWLEQLIE